MLTDRNKNIRESALGILERAFRDNLSLNPGVEVIEYLVKKINY